MNAALSVAKWLLGREGITAATPVAVRIGRRSHPAVMYTDSENGVEETRLYVIGTLPPLYEKMRRLCYRTDDSAYDWHLIAWFRQRVACAEWSEVYPCDSSHFILAQWSPVENWAADQCGKRPFRRIAMSITPHDEPTEAKHDEPR
jgi:hypothetical protein